MRNNLRHKAYWCAGLASKICLSARQLNASQEETLRDRGNYSLDSSAWPAASGPWPLSLNQTTQYDTRSYFLSLLDMTQRCTAKYRLTGQTCPNKLILRKSISEKVQQNFHFETINHKSWASRNQMIHILGSGNFMAK